jgi:ABC-type glycerol-3-phosphate transport system substrate-binding protein
LNYTDGRYLDAQDVTVSTANFGSLSSLADLTPYFPISDETNFIEYLVQRGYRIDGNLRAAPYDWRLASSMYGILKR